MDGLWHSDHVRLGVLALVLLIACGGDDGPTDASMATDTEPDGGVDDGPAPPALPLFDSCPDGWRVVSGDDGVDTCDPYPEAGVSDCGPGEGHFPGTPGCAPVGAACPSGDFSESLPAGANVVYVRAGATGGDGSLASPYGTIAEADVGRIPSGSILALAKGTHTAGVRIFGGLTIWGACAAETRLTASPSESGAVLDIVGSDVVVRDLAIADADRIGVWVVGEGGGATFEGVSIENTEWQGLLANGGTVAADGLLVRGTRSRTRDGISGRGIACDTGAQCTLSRVVVEDNREYGIRVADAGARMTASDVMVRRTLGQESDGTFGRGFAVEYDAAVELERVYLDENRDIGIFALESEATVRDAVIRRTLPEDADSTDGRGIAVVQGVVSLDRIVIEESRELGFFVEGDLTDFSARDLVVRSTRFEVADLGAGDGGIFQRGATGSIERVMLSDNQLTGLRLADGADVTATDLSVHDTLPGELIGQFGRGISVELGSSLSLTRARIADSREVGISGMVDTTVTGVDVSIERTRERQCFDDGSCPVGFGSAVIIAHGSTVRFERFALTESALCGIHLEDVAAADLIDGVIEGHEIGACVQVDGFDLERLQNMVVYRDNTTSLDVTMLPVPDVAGVGVTP